MFTIREITEPDVTRVVGIIRVAFEEYRGRLDPPSSAHHKTAEIVLRELIEYAGRMAMEAMGV